MATIDPTVLAELWRLAADMPELAAAMENASVEKPMSVTVNMGDTEVAVVTIS